MRVNVLKEIGARCIVGADGQRLHDLIVNPLREGDDVCLDFSDVQQFASPFFNFSIGQLLNEISLDTVRQRLHLENLNEIGKLVVDRVIANASLYQGNADYKKIVDDILTRQAGNDDAR